MSQKSSYAVFALFPLLDMLFVMRPMGMWGIVMHAAICGAALYYVVKHLKPFRLMGIVMLVAAVVYNPFRPFALGTPGWIVSDLVMMTLFYLLAWKTPLSEEGGVKHYASEKDDHEARKK